MALANQPDLLRSHWPPHGFFSVCEASAAAVERNPARAACPYLACYQSVRQWRRRTRGSGGFESCPVRITRLEQGAECPRANAQSRRRSRAVGLPPAVSRADGSDDRSSAETSPIPVASPDRSGCLIRCLSRAYRDDLEDAVELSIRSNELLSLSTAARNLYEIVERLHNREATKFVLLNSRNEMQAVLLTPEAYADLVGRADSLAA